MFDPRLDICLAYRKQRFVALGIESCLSDPRYTEAADCVHLKLSILNCLSRYIPKLAANSFTFLIQCLEKPTLVSLSVSTLCSTAATSNQVFRDHFKQHPEQAQALQACLSSHVDIKPQQRSLLVSLLQLSDDSVTDQLSLILKQLQSQPYPDVVTLQLVCAIITPRNANMLELVLPLLWQLLHHVENETVLEALNVYGTCIAQLLSCTACAQSVACLQPIGLP
jgi:hypothetical protein